MNVHELHFEYAPVGLVCLSGMKIVNCFEYITGN